MALRPRIVAILMLVAFLVLLPFIFTGLLIFAAVALLFVVAAGLLFYIRMRLALRRFRKAFELAASQAGRRGPGPVPPAQPHGSAPPPRRGKDDVLDAEFRVRDER